LEKFRNEIIPDHIPNEINYKIIILCFVAGISFHYSMTYFSSLEGQMKNSDYIIDIVSIINPLVTSIFAFVIAGFYRISKVFGYAYILLGLAYLCAATAELIYSVQYDIIGIDPYPSIADLFFAALNIFWIAHIITIIKYFGIELEYKKLILLITIFGAIVFSYIGISLYQLELEPNFEFFYGLSFVVISATTLPFVVYTVMLFKDSALGKAWYILLLSFSINISGDVWYYYLEIFGQYNLHHPVNFFWYIGYWVQTYALFKHKKVT
jgi:hypothetical protein